ncbi:EpsG family protein [Vibrio cholerae]|uniref:EpsG family protein n=1 Tax=Vibrio cholerae TaxID=666 RepID=UPI0018F08526|nr:EpsG family protein [Vibrio cholerae]EKF9147203.1 EpsG family protein [Vibrio cholerae]MBJ6933464.1 EpsG family protein [Vibrio cholerae]
MITYIFIWFFLVLLIFLISQFDREFNHTSLRFFLLFVFFYIGFRHQVGSDWYSYLIIFEEIRHVSFFQAITLTDPAYASVNWLAQKFGFTIHFVNLFCAFLFTLGFGYFCLKQPQPWLVLLIAFQYLITVVAMGYTRQSVAVGISMAALIALVELRPWRFVGLILCASLFHKSAVILFVLFPVALPQLQIGRLFVIGLFTSGLGLVLVLERLGGMWDLYISQGMESDGGLVRVLLNAVPAIGFLLFKEQWQQRWPSTYKLALWLSVMALVLLPLQILASTAVDRISLYLISLQLLVLARLPLLFQWKVQSIFCYGLVILYSLLYFIWLSFSFYAQESWIPYNNLLFL